MWDDRWQLVSKDTNDVFGIIRGDAVALSTVELPYFGIGPNEFRYESCLFTATDSEVLRRYKTKREAIAGHERLAKKYKLK